MLFFKQINADEIEEDGPLVERISWNQGYRRSRDINDPENPMLQLFRSMKKRENATKRITSPILQKFMKEKAAGNLNSGGKPRVYMNFLRSQ